MDTTVVQMAAETEANRSDTGP